MVGAFCVTFDFRDCRPYCFTKTPIVLIVHIDDRHLLGEELRQLLITASHKWKVLVSLVMHSEYDAEYQTRIIQDEVCVEEKNRLHHLIQLVLDVLACACFFVRVWRNLWVMSTGSFVRCVYGTWTATQKMTPFFAASETRSILGTLFTIARSKSERSLRLGGRTWKRASWWKYFKDCQWYISLNSTTGLEGVESGGWAASVSSEIAGCWVSSALIGCWGDGIGCWVGVKVQICARALGGEWSRGWCADFARWDSTGGLISSYLGLMIEKLRESGLYITQNGVWWRGDDCLVDWGGCRCWSWWGIADRICDKGSSLICRLYSLSGGRWQSQGFIWRLERLQQSALCRFAIFHKHHLPVDELTDQIWRNCLSFAQKPIVFFLEKM